MLLSDFHPDLFQESIKNLPYLVTVIGMSSNGHWGPKSPHPPVINAAIFALFNLFRANVAHLTAKEISVKRIL